MAVKRFEDLEIWKEARRLTHELYQLTKTANFCKDFSLCGQIQRAAISVMSNIAEGFEEVRSQIYVAVDQGYVSQEKAVRLTNSFNRLSSMISNLISYLRSSGMKGEKFRKRE